MGQARGEDMVESGGAGGAPTEEVEANGYWRWTETTGSR